MKFLRRLLARIRGAFNVNARDDAIEREMRAHLAIATEEFIRRGMSPADARRAALVESRGIAQAKEAYRDQQGLPLLQSLDRGVRHAAHGLRRNRSFATAIVLSLALGIGLNTAIFSVLDAVVRRPLPYPDAENIMTFGVRIERSGSDAITMWEPYNTLPDWRRSQSLGPIADYSSRSGAVVQADAPAEFVRGATASANLLQVLGVRPLLGRWFAEGEGFPAVVISEALHARQFGRSADVVGRTLRVNGQMRRVIGVLPRGAGLPVGADYWLPSDRMGGQAVARIPTGVSPAAVVAELTTLSSLIQNNRKRGTPASVIMMSLQEQLFGPAKPTLRILFVAAVVLLLIACANVTNLALARTLERRRELALRMALGASVRSLGALVVIENLLLTLAGGLLGLGLALGANRVLAAFAPPSLTLARDVNVQPGSMLFAVGLVAACCAIVSAAPIIHVSRQSPNDVIGNSGRSESGRSVRSTRRVLVVAQLALALVLLTGSGLLIRSIHRLTRPERLGFSPRGVVILTARLFGDAYRGDESKQSFMDRLIGRIREIPGVDNVTVGPPPAVGGSGTAGLTEGFDMIFSYQRDRSSPNATVWAKFVDENYAGTFKTRLRSGRFFRATDDSLAPRVVLLNATAARLFFGGDSPIGRTLPVAVSFDRNTPKPTVVGVIDDAIQLDLTVDAKPEVLAPSRQNGTSIIANIAVHASVPSTTLIGTLQRVLREIDPSLAASRLQSMDEVVNESLARHRFVLRLLFVFAALGVVLAAIGLYGVISYFVAQRSPEFGVRMALGARRDHVIRLVLGEGLAMVGVGILIAIPVAMGAARLLEALLYKVGTADVATFIAGAGFLSATAVTAAYLPARRAGAVDPARALRSE